MAFDDFVGLADRGQRETTWIDARLDLAGFRKPRRLTHDFTVMGATFAGQQRDQGEHAGIGRGAERERSQQVRAPTETAHHMAKTTD